MSSVEKYVGPSQAVVQQLSVEQVKYIANTEMVPKAYRGKVPEIMACILTGRGLGLEDMHALRSIYVVDGKATLSAELMVFLVRRAGHSITGKSSAKAAEVTGTRADNGDTFTVTYTIEEANEAGLTGKPNWKRHPADMLWARCVSRLCRRLFPDLLGGVSHIPDEAELSPEERVDEAIGEVRVPQDDAGPDDTPRGNAGDGGHEEAAAGQQAQAGADELEPVGEPQAPSAAPGDEPVDAEWEAIHDAVGALEAEVEAELGEPEPHTGDSGQGSIFEQMADQAIRAKAEKDGES